MSLTAHWLMQAKEKGYERKVETVLDETVYPARTVVCEEPLASFIRRVILGEAKRLGNVPEEGETLSDLISRTWPRL